MEKERESQTDPFSAPQIVTETNTVTGADGPAQLTYYRYPDGSVAQLGYPNNVWVRRDYTARGQLERVSDSATGWKMAVEYTYLDDGKVDYSVYGDNTRTDYQYDGRGFMSSFRTYIPASNQEIYRRNYFRDERDRITIIQRGTSNQANAMENGHGDRFRYDAEGQMVEAWYDAPNPLSTGYGNARYELFNYDELGNRQGWACLGRLGWQEFSRKDNKLNQYSMWSPFSVIKQDEDIGAPWGTPQHANGVTMQEGNVTAALNQMMMVNTAGMGSNWMFFGYDPLGRRVQQWVGQLNPNPGNPPNYVPAIGNSPGTFFYYDGWNLVQEGPAFNSATRNYVHGARVDEIVKQITPDNWYERYFHYEGRGHCAFQTDIWGNIVEQYDYDAFGQPYFYYASGNAMTVNGQPGSLWGNRFLFTGREYLADATFPDLRLYDFRNRMYQPELGRFMSPDPKHFEAGDYNLYRYCHNDPVNKTDPDGQMPLSKLTVKGVVKILRTKTAHQLIAKGKNLAAGSKKEAKSAIAKSLPNRKVVVHTRDRAGYPPHAQPKPRLGNMSHVSFPRKAAAAVTASAYLGANSVIAQIIDFFSPLSIGQDVFDVVDAFNEASVTADTINDDSGQSD